MNSRLIQFDDIDWVVVGPHAREKRSRSVDQACRILQLAPGFKEADWCQKAHAGYVIDGHFSIEFRDRVIQYRADDGFCIQSGIESEHRAIVENTVTLFLVED